MADWIAPLILAIVQGISEWFPISSSGHLVLFSHLLGYENTLAFDVALHFGTLMAVFVYFGKDLTDMLRDLLSGKFHTENSKMAFYVVIASIPAAIFGFLFHNFFESTLNDLSMLAIGFSLTGLLLVVSSLDLPVKSRKMSAALAFGIGLAQVAALFRGISRSGSTICSGVLLGLDPKKAARFSFLLSIPIIFGANVLSFGNNVLPTAYLWPALVSFVVGIASIHVLLKFVLTSKKNLRWFGIYVLCVALGLGIYLFLK